MRSKTLIFRAVAFCVLFTLSYQSSQSQKTSNPVEGTYRGPSIAIIRDLLAEYDKKGGQASPTSFASTPIPATTNIKFYPSGNSGVSQAIADVLGQNPQQKTILMETFEDMKKAYEAEVGPQGRSNDIAAALTFFLTTNVMVFNDAPAPAESASEAMYLDLVRIINSSPQFARISNSEKQQLYDWLIYMAGFVLSNYQDNKNRSDASGLKNIQEFANLATKALTGQGLDRRVRPGETASASEPNRTNGTGISASTTTTNDGWTSEADAEFVKLSKGEITVYLFFPFQLTDAQRGDADLADHCWRNFVLPRFTIASAEKFSDSVPDLSNWLYYYEGTGRSKDTGKFGYIAMKADSAQGGIVTVIVVVAADKQAYKRTFPDPKGLSYLKGANRFAIKAQDIVGTWSDAAGLGLSWVNSDTGAFAGMSTTASSNEFAFGANGTYQSKHAYASTNNSGGTRGGKQQHSGRFSVSDWGLTLTGTAGTISYDAYFEAVKNGRVLHLTQKGSEGNQFHLNLIR